MMAIDVMNKAITSAKIGSKDRIDAIRRLTKHFRI